MTEGLWSTAGGCGDPTPQKENKDRREKTLSLGNRPTEQ